MPKTNDEPSAAGDLWVPLTLRVDIDRRAEGGLTPSKPPYGYRVNEVGEWEQVPDQIAVIRTMAALRIANGASYPTIARKLNAEGIPSPKHGAKGWSPTAVWRVLRYAAYWHRPDPSSTDDPWEALRMAKAATVTGFLSDEYPTEARTGV